MPSELNDYFDFLTETLGVKNIFDFDAGQHGNNQIENTYIKYAFIVEGLGQYSASENELLLKMITAAKTAGSLNERDCQIFDESIDLSVTADVKIYFKNESFLESENHVSSPRILILKPELKKKTWESMKRILQIG